MKRFFIILIAGGLFVSGLFVVTVSAEEQLFGGVGLQVVPTIHGDLVVLNVLEEAPAAKKGLLPGDMIFQVGDFTLYGSEFGKVISEHLWGPVGSSVEIHYRRPGVDGESRVTLQRSAINPHLTVTPAVQNGSLGSDGDN